MQVNFGAGTAIGKRTDISPATPSFLAVLQSIDLNFDQSLKELIGQQKIAVDVAPTALKITGKASYARIQASALNNLFLGGTLTGASGITMATNENRTVPASVTYTIVALNGATFLEDFGVFYQGVAATAGNQLALVTGAPGTGSYSVNATGTYTFASGDASAGVQLFYSYSVTTQNQIAIANAQMGTGPTFELFLQEQYVNNLGQTQLMAVKLNACKASKFALSFKNQDYTLPDFEFQAFADSNGNVGTISTTG